jgi:hypothetical protein
MNYSEIQILYKNRLGSYGNKLDYRFKIVLEVTLQVTTVRSMLSQFAVSTPMSSASVHYSKQYAVSVRCVYTNALCCSVQVPTAWQLRHNSLITLPNPLSGWNIPQAPQ